jgi:ketopantoate reductase
MRIVVVVEGVGVVGGYFGGALAPRWEDLWRRGATLQAPREHGLRVDDVGNNFVVRPVRPTNNPQALGAVDVVPLAVRGWQVPTARSGRNEPPSVQPRVPPPGRLACGNDGACAVSNREDAGPQSPDREAERSHR